GIAGLAGDTDGIDGITDAAGVVFDPATLERARRGGLDPAARLDDNDAYSLFSATGGLIVTGPTLTNVNDFRATLICHPSDPQAS
ncbi:MAG: MOFRL family protein, partial [Alphaproteobacteria bacterium]